MYWLALKLTKEEKENKLQERRQKKYNETHKMVNEIDYKLCSRCNEWLRCSEEFYYKNKSNGIDGYNPYCKNCSKNQVQQWRKDNPEQALALMHKYHYSDRGKERKRIAKRKYRENGKQLDYQRNNRDKIKQYSENRKHKNHDISIEEWENCKNYFSYRCAYCGLPIEEHFVMFRGKLVLFDFSKEHVEDNGANDLSNCIPSCKKCNSQKNTYKIDDWYNENNNKFSKERLSKIHKWLNEAYKMYKE